MEELIFLNRVRVKDKVPWRSIFYGEGLFETFRWYRKRPRYLEKHLDRLREGSKILNIPYPGNQNIKDNILTAIETSGLNDAYVKVCILSEGDTTFYKNAEKSSILLIVKQYTQPRETVSVCVSSIKRYGESVLLKIKTLNYLENILAKREALERGFDDSIFLNSNEELTESSSSNIFWTRGKALFTPSVDCGLLPGITRELVIEAARDLGFQINERRYKLLYLLNSDFAFLTNALNGMVYVDKINEQEMPPVKKDFKLIKEALNKKLDW